MRMCAITTTDNPFNPLIDFENWYRFDMEKNYGTCSYLARIAITSETLSEKDFDEEIERAIDEIVEKETLIGGTPQYRKVVEDIEDEAYKLNYPEIERQVV